VTESKSDSAKEIKEINSSHSLSLSHLVNHQWSVSQTLILLCVVVCTGTVVCPSMQFKLEVVHASSLIEVYEDKQNICVCSPFVCVGDN